MTTTASMSEKPSFFMPMGRCSDISFCLKECARRDCRRNHTHTPKDRPFSVIMDIDCTDFVEEKHEG